MPGSDLPEMFVLLCIVQVSATAAAAASAQQPSAAAQGLHCNSVWSICLEQAGWSSSAAAGAAGRVKLLDVSPA